MTETPMASGIYCITCTTTGKIYIGSAMNFRQRRNLHFSQLRRNKHDNPYLQRAWNKYGEQAFTFEVLEFVLPIFLTAREQYWFKKLKPFGHKGFNIAREAGSNLGMKQSPEQRKKLSQALLFAHAKRVQIENLTGLLTIKQAAKELAIHPATLQRAITAGKLEATRTGRWYRITREALQKYIDSLTVNATTEVK